MCRPNSQDGLFISDYVSMFFIMSSHFLEVPLKNEPFLLLTIFAEAIVKFVNWGHFKVLICLYSIYFMPCEAILDRELSSFQIINIEGKKCPLSSKIVKDSRNY